MDRPLVSIIIPFYNSEEYITETIECAINQTWTNKEILLIDDGSTDSSLILAKKYENDSIRVFHQQNKGASSARNHGLKKAKGSYIQFLDADDLLSEDKIEKQINILMNTDDSCIIGCKWIRFKNSINETIGALNPPEVISRNLTPIEWLIYKKTMVLHAWLIPKSIIDSAGIWNEELSCNDDGEYFYRVVAKSNEVLFCKNAYAYYRTENTGKNISYLNSKAKYYSIYNAALSYKQILNTLTNSSEKSQKAIGNYFKELSYLFYAEYPELFDKCEAQPEIKLADIPWTTSGITKIFHLILGWKATKLIKAKVYGQKKT